MKGVVTHDAEHLKLTRHLTSILTEKQKLKGERAESSDNSRARTDGVGLAGTSPRGGLSTARPLPVSRAFSAC